MSDWFGAIMKRVDRFFGFNWIEFLDEGARPAVRRFAQRCFKYARRCVSWIKKIGRIKKQRYQKIAECKLYLCAKKRFFARINNLYTSL